MGRERHEALRKAVIFLARQPLRNIALARALPNGSSEPQNRWAASNPSAGDSIHRPYLSPQSRQRSSGATFVPMMEPTNFRDRDDAPGPRRLDWA